MKPHDSLSHLSDQQLVDHIDVLALSERQATARLVASLAELDARGVHFALGYSSLFAYCRERLRLSEHAALNRIEAARAGRAFPLILERLGEGTLTLTAVRLLRPVLTVANHRDVIEQARHMGKQEVLELIARVRPQPPVPSVIRKLPPPRATVADREPTLSVQPDAGGATPETCAEPQHAARRPVVAPLSPDHYRIQVTFTRSAHDKLRQAQALLRHQLPSGDAAAVLERGLDALLTELLKRKAAQVGTPRQETGGNPSSRHIPAHVKRAVWARDAGACAFAAADGRRCGEKGRLEYHHVIPFAAGGKTALENIELRCSAHNRYEAEQHFGAVVMSLFREARAPDAGALPDTLTALVPAYLSAVPVDPYSGSELLYGKSSGAYTVYSVGPNRADDGGDLTSELEAVIQQGFGRRIIRGLDVGVRVIASR